MIPTFASPVPHVYSTNINAVTHNHTKYMVTHSHGHTLSHRATQYIYQHTMTTTHPWTHTTKGRSNQGIAPGSAQLIVESVNI